MKKKNEKAPVENQIYNKHPKKGTIHLPLRFLCTRSGVVPLTMYGWDLNAEAQFVEPKEVNKINA